jgi:hypothetical protein
MRPATARRHERDQAAFRAILPVEDLDSDDPRAKLAGEPHMRG